MAAAAACLEQQALEAALGQLAQALTPSRAAWQQRAALVDEHVSLLAAALASPHPIRICPFGSSLSGLTDARSDIDLGLFGSIKGVKLEDLGSKQTKELLNQVSRSLQRARLANGRATALFAARVPVLKYTERAWGLDCDISIQPTGSLLKARLIRLLHCHFPALSPLYRLVKFWAAAHELNDASRSTFNSTSLLYLTIFYLQCQGLLPPLSALVPPEQLRDARAPLLHAPNKRLWDDPRQLDALLAAADSLAGAWAARQRQQRPQQQAPGLCQLLCGWFEFYAEPMSEWATGARSALFADLWSGRWSEKPALDGNGGGGFQKPYLFKLQDPFDPTDCPTRAIGTPATTNGLVGALIAHLVCSSRAVCQRYLGSSSSSGPAEPPLRQRLCHALAWLFGPAGVQLLSGGGGGHGSSRRSAAAPAGTAADWAAAPFDPAIMQQWQQQQQRGPETSSSSSSKGKAGKPGSQAAALHAWLIATFAAGLEPPAPAAAEPASSSGGRGSGGRGRGRGRGGRSDDSSSSSTEVLCLDHLKHFNNLVKSGQLPGPLGAALTAAYHRRSASRSGGADNNGGSSNGGSSSKTPAMQQRAEANARLRSWQQQQLLAGPPLPAADAHIGSACSQLVEALTRHQVPLQKPGVKVVNTRAVNDAFRQALLSVAHRLQQLGATVCEPQQEQPQQEQPQQEQPQQEQPQQEQPQQEQELARALDSAAEQVGPAAAPAERSTISRADNQAEAGNATAAQPPGIGGYGLQAVLEQHGFMPVLQRWSLASSSGDIWAGLLPTPDSLQQQAQIVDGQQQQQVVDGQRQQAKKGRWTRAEREQQRHERKLAVAEAQRQPGSAAAGLAAATAPGAEAAGARQVPMLQDLQKRCREAEARLVARQQEQRELVQREQEILARAAAATAEAAAGAGGEQAAGGSGGQQAEWRLSRHDRSALMQVRDQARRAGDALTQLQRNLSAAQAKAAAAAAQAADAQAPAPV